MKVFIDTNILLEMYHLSGPDLEELRKLVKLVETGKVELLLPQQVVDEFWRNRESVIADALKRFRESKAQATIPNVIRSYPESAKLRSAVDGANAIVKDLETKVRLDIDNKSLKADEIILELFAAVPAVPISRDVIAAAQLRTEIGNPPGKKGSLGDAINWEWLLQCDVDPATAEIVILSADGDFESELIRGKPKEFLYREWSTTHPHCALRLEKSLAEFLHLEFADIKLADEVVKVVAIEQLEEAGSFTSTHMAVHRLSKFEDFTDSELERLLHAYLENDQVYWILGDGDVRRFGSKIMELANSEDTVALADRLRKLLAETETDDDDGEPVF